MVTLELIEAKQTELGELIQRFKTQAPAAAPTTYTVPAVTIELRPGERYAGLLLDDSGAPLHHVVLLPGDEEDVTWEGAKAWAASIGGELPMRREQSLLFADLKGEFQGVWYWSAEVHATNGSDAWGQAFDYGSQLLNPQGFEGRARAVRRVKA